MKVGVLNLVAFRLFIRVIVRFLLILRQHVASQSDFMAEVRIQFGFSPLQSIDGPILLDEPDLAEVRLPELSIPSIGSSSVVRCRIWSVKGWSSGLR